MADITIEHELIKQAAAFVDLKVTDTQIEHFMENTRVRITMEEDPEVPELRPRAHLSPSACSRSRARGR